MHTDEQKNVLENLADSTLSLNLRQKRFLFMSISYFSAVLSFSLVIYYLFFDSIPQASLILFAYTLSNIINVGLYVYHKEIDLHINFYLTLTLMVPFLVHIVVYHGENSPIFWGICAPIVALLLQNYKKAFIWFSTYVSLIIIIMVLDYVYYPQLNRSLLSTNEFISQLNFIGLTTLCFVTVFYIIRRAEKLGTSNNILQNENLKSEELISQLLPEEIAMRLKNEKSVITDSFDQVTVLFADMVGFTELSSRISPVELVDLLNVIFSALDRIIDDYGMEKIKTMGDAYMAAAGIPTPSTDNAEIAANVALKFMEEVKKFSEMSGMDIRVRIGLHTGPVVAGVIGIKRSIYDLWGDTVNIAARMEHHGIPDKIQVTRETYNLLNDKFNFIPRGQIEVKGKGIMDTYILIDKKESYAQKQAMTYSVSVAA